MFLTAVNSPSWLPQVEKAKRSEQSVATCVLEVRVRDGGASAPSQLLLVQRPESGLLAGAPHSASLPVPPACWQWHAPR